MTLRQLCRVPLKLMLIILLAVTLNACTWLPSLEADDVQKVSAKRTIPKHRKPTAFGFCPAQGFSYYLEQARYWVANARDSQQQFGLASWYGKYFHGRLTANGERYNMHAATAAHKLLPMNTLVEITNLVNGKRTIVRINDRGPFIDKRIVDLSLGAAREIDMVEAGVVPVRLLVIRWGKHNIAANTSRHHTLAK